MERKDGSRVVGIFLAQRGSSGGVPGEEWLSREPWRERDPRRVEVTWEQLGEGVAAGRRSAAAEAVLGFAPVEASSSQRRSRRGVSGDQVVWWESPGLESRRED